MSAPTSPSPGRATAHEDPMTFTLRPERPDDAAAIHEVTRRAFLGAPHAAGTEAHIVDALREAGALTLSLVAEEDDRIVGHVAISPVSVDERDDLGWFGLGPLSVAPERQRRGVGSALVRAALGQLRERGATGCVLLGDPAYYHRFGFVAAAPLLLPGVPPEYFQAVTFRGSRPAGVVRYHSAFEVTP